MYKAEPRGSAFFLSMLFIIIWNFEYMKYSLNRFLLIILLICFTAPDCIAKSIKKQFQHSKITQKIDKAHKKISGYILNSAAWLDSFFSNERYEA